MGPRLQHWLRAMNDVEAHRIALRNLAFDVRHRRVPQDLLQEFVQYVEQHWPDGDPRPVADTMIKRFTAAHNAGRVCKGKPRPKDPPRCSRVMEARSLFHNHIRPEGLSSIEDDVSDDEIERVVQVGVGNAAHGRMSSERVPFAWITKTDRVDSIRDDYKVTSFRPNATFATALRDALGLYHFIRQEKLIEVVYPENATNSYVLAPPTFFEGLDLVYRSAESGDGWGETVPLNGTTALPEAIHEPIPFSDSFSIRAVGRPAGTELSFRWNVLAGSPDIVEELGYLIPQYLSESHAD